MSGIVRANNTGQSGVVANVETIDSDDYVDASIDNAHLANDAVGADELASDAVVNASIASGAAVAFSKMANLTASRALVSDGSGDVSVSAVTSTEVGYLDGVTSAIQTQIDAAGGARSVSGTTDNGVVTFVNSGSTFATESNLTFATDLTVTGGNVVIGTGGKGIDFSAQTATSAGSVVSEVLDHYEEGTFTPTIIGAGGSAGSWAQTLASQYYIRIGSIVHISFQINVTNKGSYSGLIKVTGLPFACSGNVTAGTLCGYASTSVDAALRQPEVVPSSSYIQFKGGSRLDGVSDWAELVTGYYTTVQATYRI